MNNGKDKYSAINIVFDGPPGHLTGNFVEVELDNGESINAGEWIQRGDYWILRIASLPIKEEVIFMPLDLENIYKYHAPQEGQKRKYEALRTKAKELAQMIEDFCPVSREQNVALTHLETTTMWANAAIARG